MNPKLKSDHLPITQQTASNVSSKVNWLNKTCCTKFTQGGKKNASVCDYCVARVELIRTAGDFGKINKGDDGGAQLGLKMLNQPTCTHGKPADSDDVMRPSGDSHQYVGSDHWCRHPINHNRHHFQTVSHFAFSS